MHFLAFFPVLMCVCAFGTVCSGSLIVNSINAIKSQIPSPAPGTPSHGVGPLLVLEDMVVMESNHNLLQDPIQVMARVNN